MYIAAVIYHVVIFTLHTSIQILYFKFLLYLATLITFCDILTLVIELLTFCEADLHLCKTTLEIDTQRNKRIALLCNLSDQLVDLCKVQQQFELTKRILIENVPFLLWADVHTVNDHFSVFDADKRFLNAAFPHAQRLYLCAM